MLAGYTRSSWCIQLEKGAAHFAPAKKEISTLRNLNKGNCPPEPVELSQPNSTEYHATPLLRGTDASASIAQWMRSKKQG